MTIDPPMMTCPKCEAQQEDHDGLGVLHCAACGYCDHPSASGSPLRCDLCGCEFVSE